MTRRTLFSTMLSAAAASAQQSREPIDIGSRRELFVDRHLIEAIRGEGALRLATPVDAGPALALDRLWEGAFCGYSTVLQPAPNLYRLYYRGLPLSGQDGDNGEVTCCAESADGIRWTRPQLDLFPRPDAPRNNIILAGAAPCSHNFCPFLDTRPVVASSERYKAVAGVNKSGLFGFVSADGLRWRKTSEQPILPPQAAYAFDSQNVAFYSEREQQYVLYYRTWRKIGATNYRWVSRAVSADFANWTRAGEMTYGDAPAEHLYTNQTSAYFRAPHLYLGICARFLPGRQVLTPEQATQLRVDPKYFQDCSDAVFVTSRGGNTYTRTFLDAFLRPGVGFENWVSRSNYPALNVVPTGLATMSFYVNRNYGQPTAYLRRYELRLDGFASFHAGYQGGELLTQPFTMQGSQLELNYSTSAAGGLRVEILDAAGTPLPGFSLADATDRVGDEIEGTYRWKGVSDLSALRGRPLRLRFVLKDADVFAFRFISAGAPTRHA
jgi:hypothetical protein